MKKWQKSGQQKMKGETTKSKTANRQHVAE